VHPQDCVVIRHLRVDEADVVARLRATSFGGLEANEIEIASAARLLAEHLASGDFVCVVAVHEGDIASYGVGMIHQRLPVRRNPSGQ
jgi:hypothetical protein